MVNGNTEGVRDVILNRLDTIYGLKSNKYEVASREILEIMVEVTERIHREVSVTIDGRGTVTEVTIGDSASVSLPVLDFRESKLSPYRVVHTHPNGTSRLSALDVSALLKMKLSCLAAVAKNEQGIFVTMGFPTVFKESLMPKITKELTLEEALAFDIGDEIADSRELLAQAKLEEKEEERALLVGIESKKSLEELKELAHAANIQVSELILQSKESQDAAYYVGSGKLEELTQLCQVTRSNVIIADDELSGIQIKNMEDITGVKVIDRTTLILEIFSRRAVSREGKLQIEAAQLKYRLNRLLGMGSVLSRTGGGIGTRGPGETKLETDRRKIRRRFYDLSQELDKISKVRHTQRENRHRQDLPQVALVGYTNAGKSTLRNALADSSARGKMKKDGVFEADMLFATLDTTTRAIELSDKRVIALTDTVGFIRKLPHDLVEAFKSTLEEVIYADLLIHVVDASSADSLAQIEAVEEVLTELGAVNKPVILALNKVDRGIHENISLVLDRLAHRYKVCQISAATGEGLPELMTTMGDMLPLQYETVKLRVPFSEQKLVSYLHNQGNVLEEEFDEEGTLLTVQLLPQELGRVSSYLVEE